MRRLFWTFPDGLPGAGLLLMRLATVGTLMSWGAIEWHRQPVWCAVEGLAGLFLLAGLGTPVAGAVVAITEAWHAGADSLEAWNHGLLAVLAASVALIGPGAFSVDAWLFGWHRIDVGAARSSRLERGDGKAE